MSAAIFVLGAVALGALAPQANAALFNFNWESGGTAGTTVGLHGGYHVSVPSNAVRLARLPAPKEAPRSERGAATMHHESSTHGFLTIRPKTFRLPTQPAR